MAKNRRIQMHTHGNKAVQITDEASRQFVMDLASIISFGYDFEITGLPEVELYSIFIKKKYDKQAVPTEFLSNNRDDAVAKAVAWIRENET